MAINTEPLRHGVVDVLHDTTYTQEECIDAYQEIIDFCQDWINAIREDIGR